MTCETSQFNKIWLARFFKCRDIDFPKRHVTAASSAKDMDILSLFLRRFIKFISKWSKKLFQKAAASKTYYLKVG